MNFLLPTLLFSLLVLAAPHGHLQHRQAMPKRNGLISAARMSVEEVKSIYTTCWGGAIPFPERMPSPDVVAEQLDVFTKPANTPDHLAVKNYCSYPIYYKHFDGSANPAQSVLEAGASISRPLTGTVFKASKTQDMAKELLVEYAKHDSLWYNLSLITCVEGGDLSKCPGHEGGLQLGNAEAKSFQCAPGAWCDDQAYVYQENLCKKQNPVSMCSPSLGLTMEFCAGAKPQ
ncbi:hypothetical protein NX059_010839 [Plenodomus lindquistii]|nr:hypothetical protein NX059_010839 [Plenodomus lindquistii]